jgi:hypothetical protein
VPDLASSVGVISSVQWPARFVFTSGMERERDIHIRVVTCGTVFCHAMRSVQPLLKL